MSDTKNNSSKDRKLPSRQYIMPRSRYLDSSCNSDAASRAGVGTAGSRQPVKPVDRSRRKTEMLPPPAGRARTTDAVQLSINDSGASAALPHVSHLTGPGRPRRRSLSAGKSNSVTSLLETEGSAECAQAIRVAQAVLHKRLLALLDDQTDHHLKKLEDLLREIQQEREQLIAELELEQLLKTYRLLCIENEALKTIEQTLFGSTTLPNGQHDTEQKPEDDAYISLLEQISRLTTNVLVPTSNRLPLRSIQCPANPEQLDDDLQQAVATAKLFSSVSGPELENLEALANSAEQLLECARTSIVPGVEAQQLKLKRALQLFGHEASLRMEKVQREWLQEFEKGSCAI